MKIPQLIESSFQETQRWEYAQALVCLSAPETQRCLELSVHKSARIIQARKLFKGGNYFRKYGPLIAFMTWKFPNLKNLLFRRLSAESTLKLWFASQAPETQRCLETQPSVAASRRALQYVLLQSLLYYVIGKIYARPSSDCTTLLPDLPNSCLHNFDSTRTNYIDWKSWLLLT